MGSQTPHSPTDRHGRCRNATPEITSNLDVHEHRWTVLRRFASRMSGVRFPSAPLKFQGLTPVAQRLGVRALGCSRNAFCQPTEQAMSVPQHMGDLILPWSLGHCETCTVEPSSRVRTAFSRGASHCPHVALTDISQLGHEYVGMKLQFRPMSRNDTARTICRAH